MARLSDLIEEFIKSMIENNNESELQIQRNELANYFSCAPSQINYVLTTRFTTDRGYYIESRRGGGGYIIIRRIEFEQHKSLADIINEKIGTGITYDSGVQIIDGLLQSEIVSQRESYIMKAAINDRTLLNLAENRKRARAEILKAMITTILM
jgi:transcriptional regulator of stress and heat shock response